MASAIGIGREAIGVFGLGPYAHGLALDGELDTKLAGSCASRIFHRLQ